MGAHEARSDIPARIDERAGQTQPRARGLLDTRAARGVSAQGRQPGSRGRRGVRGPWRVREDRRSCRTARAAGARQAAARPRLRDCAQGRPARAQPLRRRDHQLHPEDRRHRTRVRHREHRRHPIRAVHARDRRRQRRVLLRQPRRRGPQGTRPKGQDRRHPYPRTHRLPERQKDHRGPRNPHRGDRPRPRPTRPLGDHRLCHRRLHPRHARGRPHRPRPRHPPHPDTAHETALPLTARHAAGQPLLHRDRPLRRHRIRRQPRATDRQDDLSARTRRTRSARAR